MNPDSPQIDQSFGIDLVGNVAGNLNQDAFQKGTIDELNLQNYSVKNKIVLIEFFRENWRATKLPEPEALNQGIYRAEH